MSDERWPTAITNVSAGSIKLRGYPIEELMGRVSFSDAIHLAFAGELPSPAASAGLAAVLVASVDHSGGSPSALTARTVASAGAPIGTAAAAGLLAISRFHGAVIEDCMHAFARVGGLRAAGEDLDGAAARVVAGRRAEGGRIGGFGHRMHDVDPRPERLFAICREHGLDMHGNDEVARALEHALGAATGRPVPLNLDGAIAVVFAAIGYPPEIANPLFTIGRFVGLNAQAWEETTRMRPMRAIHPRAYDYDGPGERHLDGAA